MESKLANGLKREQLEEHRRLSREERLRLFVKHCRIVAQLKRPHPQTKSSADLSLSKRS